MKTLAQSIADDIDQEILKQAIEEIQKKDNIVEFLFKQASKDVIWREDLKVNMNFEEDVRIDENALDVEWLEQPSLVIKYARFSADARKIADLAKERLDIRTAELDRDIRAFPENYGLQKITESVVANTIILQPAWKDANEAYIDARFEQTMSQEIFRAITDRKDSLENLVRLHGAQYFAGPSVPRDLTAERQGRYNNKQANGAVGAALNKRKKG